MARDIFNYTWIEPDRVMIGSIPTCGADIDLLARLGIQHIFSLTRRALTDCSDIDDCIDRNELRVTHEPIPDCDIPSHSVASFLVNSIHASYIQRQPFYVHCRGGIGRSGMILQAYYIKWRGYSLAQARELLSTRWNIQHVAHAAQQGSPQREWIEKVAKGEIVL